MQCIHQIDLSLLNDGLSGNIVIYCLPMAMRAICSLVQRICAPHFCLSAARGFRDLNARPGVGPKLVFQGDLQYSCI
ncbi:uncharacterized protein LACBIDRAFT_301676 [Laccaria bicolor S238N-H82]|uniref:Predicted protein n=1 Tax=Laccaria bicolor (strain S238N-H82 / ATCC MYA-4686) TaxID=486041 RepID=B0CP13_LACBS|nr:uncharacterized protein LACBIDRAFT_301676 [Laccaria bicolor S238N-H82]EDR15394.1 predicted protein [Laccaria bicolor S238N-H82]|eukprot:XP_001873602.1 predicted protein [Laccaria bicolor S238N-H82]